MERTLEDLASEALGLSLESRAALAKLCSIVSTI